MKPTNRPEDRPLTDFLRQHRPLPPPPDPQLEMRLFAEIRATQALERTQSGRWKRTAIAAIALLLGGLTARQLWVPSPRPAELAELASFVEQSWYCSAQSCDREVWELE